MIEAILFMLGLGLACGAILGVASRVFYLYEDPRISAVEGYLAGANCGACGYTGCGAAAEAVVRGQTGPSVCVISGLEAAENVASLMGLTVGSAESFQSTNSCTGGTRARDKFNYMGINSCNAIVALYGGKRECQIGCLGYGDCVKACSFDAIKIGKHGYPVIDEMKCVGCGACKETCPKSIIEINTMSERLLQFNTEDDPLAPCRQTCPAEINIPKFIGQIRDGDYQGAVSTIRERNPLLLACGRVCPYPCEAYCRRAIGDTPVAINLLKRFVADNEMKTGSRIPVTRAPDTGKRIAIIGGGPSGLSCAYFLRRVGHSVTIFEAMPKLGGMLRYGIPEYRLPKKVLDWEIQGILDLGVEYHTHMKLGRDFEVGSLVASGYDAIFLGVGAWVDYKLGIEGEELEGCHTGIDFLVNIGKGETFPDTKRAAVVGGGNTAIDCARTLIRLGAEKVYIVYRRTRNEMPANNIEIEAADHEGIEFIFLAAPIKAVTNGSGKVTHLKYQKMELGEPDSSGRRRPVPIEGSDTLLEADTIIAAIGQSPDVSFKSEGKRLNDLSITRWNTLDVNPLTLQTTVPYIFAAGDAATGPSLVVDAIGGGRRAARSIDLYLSGEEVTAAKKSLLQRHIPETLFSTINGVKTIERVKMPELPVEERVDSFIEVDQVISEEAAYAESRRCLSCCRFCYNKDT